MADLPLIILTEKHANVPGMVGRFFQSPLREARTLAGALRGCYSGTTRGAVMATTATTATAAAATRSAAGTVGGAPVPKLVSADQLDQLPWLSSYLTCQ